MGRGDAYLTVRFMKREYMQTVSEQAAVLSKHISTEFNESMTALGYGANAKKTPVR